MVQVNLEEAKARLRDLVEAVFKGEVVLIVKNEETQQAVQLVPVGAPARRQFGSAKGLIVMAEDFPDDRSLALSRAATGTNRSFGLQSMSEKC
ncbi:MAG: hypothetical protein RMK65_04955 [Anaerolineae bacterium]|nr:hypothetical protein [Anaerolineae bacterium]MCX8068649.1 hypothetical protein [Anaerolineae bacterium]MDW7991485.1 hypothetical protein [Anaerolineae bacterium]